MLGLLQETTGREISMGHRYPPQLVGFDVSVGFKGQGKALLEALNFVQDTVIRPKQQLFESGLNILLAQNDFKSKAFVMPLITTEENEQMVEDADDTEEIITDTDDTTSNR